MFKNRQDGLDRHLQQIKDRDDIINKIFVVSMKVFESESEDGVTALADINGLWPSRILSVNALMLSVTYRKRTW